MNKALRMFLRKDEGLTMVEYAIAGSVIAVGCVLAFTNLGAQIATTINSIITAIAG